MKKIHIIKKLSELGFELEDLTLGDFDIIGEWCAKKQRNPNSELYKTAGAFFRPELREGSIDLCFDIEV